ncbi:MAG: Na+/H+ antiporter subunit D [Myxococcales bacterium]|jgi:multicomponent Na+:H+ antiporter subunit D|nr:Na+/H+ antiporter subunit D [Myxococcales bacterium]
MLLILPIIVPMLTAALLLLVRHRGVQRWMAFLGSMTHLGCGIALFRLVQSEGIQVLQSGSWKAPFGIVLVADTLTTLLVIAVGVVGAATTAFGFAGVDPRRESGGYHSLFMVLLMGVSGAFLTGDLFNLYVWFEVMLVASFVLMALHRTKEQVRAAFTYVTLNLLASAILLTALGLLYGQSGTLNMADLSRQWSTAGPPPLHLPLALLFLTAFGIKAALFPWFFWLPASYHTPPAAISAIFAGLLTKVGVYSMIRVFTLLFQRVSPGIYTLILVLSAVTMVVGVTCALTQRDFRRVLSFNLVGHIGYTTLGLGLLSPVALAGSLLYVLHHIVAITNLYLVGGIFLRVRRTTDFASLGSLYRTHPYVALLSLVPIFALAGVPPLSGFIAKIVLVQASFAQGVYWAGGIALFVGLLSVLSMARLWDESFWKDAPDGVDKASPTWKQLLPIGALTLLSLGISVGAEPLLDMTSRVAGDLLEPSAYVRAVLDGDG